MSAALRLIAAPRRTELAGRPLGPVDPWLTRLVKLVPAEVVAVYLAGRPLAEARFAELWPLVCLGLVIAVRAAATHDRRGPQWVSVAVAAVSFVLWVSATGGRFPGLAIPADVAGLAVLVWTTIAPLLWKGDPRPA